MPIQTETQIIFQQILQEFRTMGAQLTELKVEMDNLQQTIEPITRIIRGDGVVQSLSTQIELLRQENNYIRQAITNNTTTINDIKQQNNKQTTEDKKSKTIILTALITGTIGLIGTIINLLLNITK